MTTKIIEDLTHVSNIIASLGLSIAEAQRHFDLDYLQSVERLIVLAQSLLGGRKADGQTSVELSAEEKLRLDQFQSIIKDFLVTLAPTRYQFTETTLTVKLDLAQHLDIAAGLGLSAGVGGVAINAAVSIGYGTDYQGAAECRTVLHAVPADQGTLRTLIDRARELTGKELAPPDRSKINMAVLAQAGSLFERLVGAKPVTGSALAGGSGKGT